MYGVALDEQKDTDNVYEVNGIKVLYDKEASKYTSGFEIDYRKAAFGGGLSIYQLNSRPNTCG